MSPKRSTTTDVGADTTRAKDEAESFSAEERAAMKERAAR